MYEILETFETMRSAVHVHVQAKLINTPDILSFSFKSRPTVIVFSKYYLIGIQRVMSIDLLSKS